MVQMLTAVYHAMYVSVGISNHLLLTQFESYYNRCKPPVIENTDTSCVSNRFVCTQIVYDPAHMRIIVVFLLRDINNEGNLYPSLLGSTAAYVSITTRTEAPHCAGWLHQQCIVGAGDFIPYEYSRCKADYDSSMIACPLWWIPWYGSDCKLREWVCSMPHCPHEGTQKQSGDWSSVCHWKQTLSVYVCVWERDWERIMSFFSNPYYKSPHCQPELPQSPLAWAGNEGQINRSTHAEGPWHLWRTLWDLG